MAGLKPRPSTPRSSCTLVPGSGSDAPRLRAGDPSPGTQTLRGERRRRRAGMDLQLEGKRALVTGSSSGIGEGIARALVEKSVAVVVHGRSREGAQRVASEIATRGGKAFAPLRHRRAARGGVPPAQQAPRALGRG